MTKPEIFALPELGNIRFALTDVISFLTSNFPYVISLFARNRKDPIVSTGRNNKGVRKIEN